MIAKRTLRHAVVAVMLLVSFLFQETWALAGTTGGINGYVRETSGAPVADATVTASAPSGVSTSKTDSQGHYDFLALAPDTYTLTVTKEGYSNGSLPGVVVFADQDSTANITADKALTTIAHVKAVGTSTGLVKSGLTADQYSVNSATAKAAAALGGGGNLDNAYSAIASVPGVNVAIGGNGWNQQVYVRGSQSFFTSYEYDGVPVNRSFDNYNGSTETNLGLQELQVYTGGGPASNSSSGTSGFINEVIKTGTYPGYAQAEAGMGGEAFYHMMRIEAGGATPDRNFSYYVGLSGTDQAFRLINNQDGANLMGPGGVYSDYGEANTPWDDLGVAGVAGAYAMCNGTTGATPASVTTKTESTINPGGLSNFCLSPYTGLGANVSFITDRENVLNFHFGINRKDGQRDDLQVLFSDSSEKTYFCCDISDLGGVNQYMLAADGQPYSGPTGPITDSPLVTGNGNYPFYVDAYVYNEPFGANVTNATPTLYQQPDTASHSAFAENIPDTDDNFWNDTGIIKLQYTHPLSDRAYARVFAYTFYSDWTETGDLSTASNYIYGYPEAELAANYLLATHTTGGELQLSDQINDKNLLTFTANYTTANTFRDNNSGFTDGAFGDLAGYPNASPVGLLSRGSNGQYTCYGSNGAPEPCYAYVNGGNLGDADSAQQNPGYFAAQQAAIPAGSAAATAGAYYANLWNGPTAGEFNSVQPQFATISLTDQFRPSDKWLFNGGIRYEEYIFGLPNDDNAANDFYGQIVSNYSCYNTSSRQVYEAPLTPGEYPPAAPTYVNGDCNAAVGAATDTTATDWVHPNGLTQDGVAAPLWSLNEPASYDLDYWSLRVSGTYTASPDTVLRFEAGRYIEPPLSASIQYLDQSGNNTENWAGFMDTGDFSPFHAIPSMSSGQYDVSLERHIRGTDMSFKLTPFYNLTNGYQEQSFIGPNFVTQIPVGQFRSMGVEAALTKGDFNRNGLSGQLSLTYTDAQIRYQAGLAANQIDVANSVISQYNELTKAGGGSPCYTPADGATGTPGTGVATCGVNDIANPYYNLPKQGLMNDNGWYAPASDAVLPGYYTVPDFYDAPWIAAMILNYRKDKLAITPSLQFVTGSSYGTPYDVTGADPRECQATDLSPGAAPNQCNYTTLIAGGATTSGELYIPNWQTGNFASLGEFHNPDILTGNLALSYDINPRITATITLTNIFHTCFGGTKAPWSAAYAPSPNYCAYNANPYYLSNFQLGAGAANPQNTSAYSAAANGTSVYPWQQQSYSPGIATDSDEMPEPFNVYFQVQVKL